MQRVGIVFLGGGLGACLRAALLVWLAPTGPTVPILLANLVGAFVLGVVFVLADEAGLLRVQARLFLAVGVLGGFTTFSTFGWGVDTLLAHHATAAACAYLLASIGGGIAAVAAGLMAGRELVVALERMAVGLLGRLEKRGLRRMDDASAGMGAIEAEDRGESA
ncbi:MAG TPA: CrcB family protein [Chloroflexota bacterium]|nr:CrcB family protein [Chloroflexota bacterium]